MNSSVKTLTIILSVVSVLFLSLTVITLFFLQQEKTSHKQAEAELAKLKTAHTKLEADLKEAKKQIFVMEEKAKESDEKINSLLDEVELEKGLRDQMKVENAALKEALNSETQTKESLSRELTASQEKAASLETQLKSNEQKKTELEQKIKTMEEQAGSNNAADVELEKIVVTPGEIPQGKIVNINRENNFVVFNLGSEDGVVG